MEKGFSRYLVTGLCFFAAGLGLVSNPSAQASTRKTTLIPAPQIAHQHVQGEMVVKFRQPIHSEEAKAFLSQALRRKFGTREPIDHVQPFRTDKTLYKIHLASESQLTTAIDTLKDEPSVAYAEPNFIYKAFGGTEPNDPDFTRTWGLKNTGQTDAAGQVGKVGSDINVLPLWERGITGSRKILVAIIDTGIDWNHPDLAGNMWTNPGESGALASNGADDDGNGFIDDVHGWNFVKNDNNPLDDHNHGTHCAGTIGGVGNNGIGVAGVSWAVSMMPVKFLDSGGSGSLDSAVEAINYARLMKVNIMSNSWGGGGFSQALQDAIDEARKAGILFVAAAGNDTNNNDGSPSYPAAYPVDNIVAVAATDNRDQLATFSNYGKNSVHVAAPGVKVYSTVKEGKYDTFSGTSMATPHVSGIAALILSDSPNMSYSDVKNRLIRTSDPTPGLRRKVVAKGRVNAFNAVYGIIPPSDEPPESLWKDVPYSLETPHPYKDKDNLSYKISVPGAKYLRVVFDQLITEAGYDFVKVVSPAGDVVEDLSGVLNQYTSDFVKGDSLEIRLVADESNAAYGFKITKIQAIQ